MIIGAFMALIFLGLPLAIIGLFIESTLDRRGGRAPAGFAESRESSASAFTGKPGGDRRRRIVYGQYSVGTAASAKRNRPIRVHSGKV